MNLTPKAIPASTKSDKNGEKYKEIAAAFEGLALDQCIEVMKEDISPATLEANARKIVTLKAGERLKISKIKDANKKLAGIRLSKVAAEPKA